MESFNKIPLETILRAQEGDSEAFTMIYKEYYKFVYFIGIQFFSDEDKAKDIIQEVFIKVYRKINTLKEPKVFHAWIRKIAYNECIYQINKNKNIVDLGDSMDVEDFEDDKDVGITLLLENKRIKEAIYSSLDSMSFPLKTVGFLRYHEDLKVMEISDILEIPKGTVNSRLNKIRHHLKVDLKKQGISPKQINSVVFVPGVITSIYKFWGENYMSDIAVDEQCIAAIIDKSTKLGGIALKNKLLFTSIITTSLIGGAIMITPHTQRNGVNLKTSEMMPTPIVSTVEETIDTAKITNVEYNQNYTNEDLYVSVETSNDNYDELLINDSNIMMISENGVYEIILKKDGYILDSMRIEINNIDKDYPELLSTWQEEEKVYIHIEDIYPGISDITYYRDGIVSNDYIYNEFEKIISFTCQEGTVNEFYVTDYAGNCRIVRVKSE